MKTCCSGRGRNGWMASPAGAPLNLSPHLCGQWLGTVGMWDASSGQLGWETPCRHSWNLHRLVLRVWDSSHPISSFLPLPSEVSDLQHGLKALLACAYFLPLTFTGISTDKSLGLVLVAASHRTSSNTSGPEMVQENKRYDGDWWLPESHSLAKSMDALLVSGHRYNVTAPGTMWQPTCWIFHWWRCRKKSWTLLQGHFRRQAAKLGAWQYSECEDSN